VPRLYRVPAGAWVCSVCVAEVLVVERPQSYYDLLPCSVCCSRSRSATMLVCDGCDQGFHMHCMGMGGKRPPPDAWFCVHCSNPGAGMIGPRTSSARPGTRAHGFALRLVHDGFFVCLTACWLTVHLT
jgi:hypothetical protein